MVPRMTLPRALMPGGSGVPPRQPPRLPIHPGGSWPCRGIRREHAGKAPSISPDQTPTGQRGGVVIHPPHHRVSPAGGCPAPELGRACNHHLSAAGGKRSGESVRCGRGMRGGRDGAALVTAGAAERSHASLLPPRCSRAGHPSAASPPSAARRVHRSQVRGAAGHGWGAAGHSLGGAVGPTGMG